MPDISIISLDHSNKNCLQIESCKEEKALEQFQWCQFSEIIYSIWSHNIWWYNSKSTGPRNSRKHLQIIGLLGLLIFCVSLIIFIWFWPSSRPKDAEINMKANKQVSDMEICTSYMTKDGLKIYDTEEMNRFLTDLTSCYQTIPTFTLVLTNPIFQGGAISKDWLILNPNQQPILTDLSIENPNIPLTNLESDCFLGFSSLRTLKISGTGIQTISKDAFNGLDSLQSLNLVVNKKIKTVERGLLKQLSSLDTIEISDIDVTEEFYKNLTDESTMLKVESVTFQYSNLKKFPSAAIKYFPGAKSLYLQYNQIETFELDTFQTLTAMEQLFLEHNNIKTLPNEIFKYVTDRKVQLYITFNYIQCDCDLEWLQNFVVSVGKNGDLNNVTCATPDYNYNVLFVDADLCSNMANLTTSSTSTTMTTTTTEMSTTTVSPYIIGGNCTTESPILPNITIDKIKIPDLEISNDPKSSDKVIVVIKSKNKPKTIFWLNQQPQHIMTYITCIYEHKGWPENHSIDISNMTASTDYIFCLSSEEFSLKYTNILGCTAFRTLPLPKDRVWLTREVRSGYLTVIVISLVVTFIFGAGSVFYLLRKKPTLLRGAQHVEIVKTHTGNMVLVKAPKSDDCASVISSTYMTIDSTYRKGKFVKNKNPPPIPERWMPPPLPRRWPREERVYLQPSAPDLLFEYEMYTRNKELK